MAPPDTTKQFDCPSCAAQLEFDAATSKAKCPYCGYEGELQHDEEEKAAAVEELDFHAYLEQAASQEETSEITTVACKACAAETTLDPNVTSLECPYCGTKIVTQGASKRVLKPKALLPFAIPREKAIEMWKDWIKGLWFAPNKLKTVAKKDDKLVGMYVPHWTYDANTLSRYSGQRGKHTWEKSGGQKVLKVKWTSVSGTVNESFDDVLVIATSSVPEKYARKLEPWDLEKLVPYNDQYLSGFRTESYQVDLRGGFDQAKGIMEAEITKTAKKDIGGDVQTITSLNTQYSDITFKHILLPLWISAYQFNDKVYRYLVNARTGKVQGERPYSWVKIGLLVVAVLIILGIIGFFALHGRRIKLRF
jgi:DNA-directed RNA polymerase subunit RPC12/RpoP